MGTRIELGGIPIDVTRKDVKHVHLTVHPPAGSVRIFRTGGTGEHC